MTQDMLRGLNQIINKVAAALPTNMRAPQHTVYDGLTQQAQTRLHQQLSTTMHSVNAEQLELSLQGKQLIIRLPLANSTEAQTSAKPTMVSIPLTDEQVKLIKSLLAQQLNARTALNQSSTLTVSIEALSNNPAIANTSLKIPTPQRTKIALALLVQANQLTLSGQIQGTNKPLANLLSLFIAPLDKVVNVPLQRLPDGLQTLVNNLNTTGITIKPILTIDAQHRQPTPGQMLAPIESRFVDVQLALNKHVIAGSLDTQHVATQTLLKAVNQLHGGKLSLSKRELTAIVQHINSQDTKPFLDALTSPKSSITLAPQLDKLSISPASIERSLAQAGTAKNFPEKSIDSTSEAQTIIVRLATATKSTDIALPSGLIKPLSQLMAQSISMSRTTTVDAANMTIPSTHSTTLSGLALPPSNNKTPETNFDPATELLKGITRLLTGHSLHQAVSMEWQAQHPDSQYFTLPNFLSGSKQPIQLLIKQEQQTESEQSNHVEQQGNKWHISLQFNIANPNDKHDEPQGTLLAKATLQAHTVNISLYGSTQTLLDNINQHKHALEQRLRQLGFTVEAQPAYQGVINDSLVDWPKPIRPANEVSV